MGGDRCSKYGHGRYELAAPSFLGAQAMGGDCDRPGPAGVQGHRLTLTPTLTLVLTLPIPDLTPNPNPNQVQGH